MLFPSPYREKAQTNSSDEPATFSRVSHLRIVSRHFPWHLSVRAVNASIGVTCADVVDQLSNFLNMAMLKEEYDAQGLQGKARILEAYDLNRGSAPAAPGSRLGKDILRLDWLGRDTVFDGLQEEEGYVREHAGGLSCTFVLDCRIPGLTVDEVRKQEALLWGE